ncbi:hypothetical protein ON010_g15912 [Phytophthora cinnamomi]|nr:hypothetical protein ON010_g15912 [Phytophthora cinnamomi]
MASTAHDASAAPRLLGLVLDAKDAGADLVLVAEVEGAERRDGVLVRNGLEVLVQVVHERRARGDVEARDLVLRDVVQVLDQRAQAVAVRGNDHLLAGLDGRHNRALPLGQHALGRELQGLGQGQQLLGHVLVLDVVARVVLAGRVEVRRRDVVAAAPLEHLLGAVLLHGGLLVQARERAVVALVEAPGLVHGDPHLVALLQHVPQRADGALEVRRVGHVEGVALLLEQLAGGGRLLVALLRELHVVPAREQVLLVPLALAVADQHQRVRVLHGLLLLVQHAQRAVGHARGQGERAAEREDHRGVLVA